MNLIKVENKEGLYRDDNNNAIINMNSNEYTSYLESYKRAYADKKKINQIENDVNQIKNDLNEIKTLLRNLSNGSW